MNKKIYVLALITGLSAVWRDALAQLTLSGQIRTRTEYRDGQGTLSRTDTVPAFFTSQRSRLNVGFAAHRLKFLAAIQDVRVWGQDASSVNRVSTDAIDGFMLHEAWAEISLIDTGTVIDNFTLKLGRQELVYDDVRLLGNLDWLQQARRHDAAVLKFEDRGWMLHAGAAFNQNAERKSNTIYNGTPTGYVAGTNGMTSLYKSLQFLYVGRKLHFGNASFLLVKDDFSRYHFAPADIDKKTPIYEQRAWSRYTTGFYVTGTALRKIGFSASAFYQGGRYREGTALHEYLLSASAMYAAGRKWSVGPGLDLTSGNNGSDPTRKFQRFDPLYGTPHKFWGYMDYFYVADGFGPHGLADVYLKSKYKAKDNITMSLDLHHFALPNAVTDENGSALSKTLGREIDFVASYAITKAIGFEGGYCVMLATETLASQKVKNVNRADTSASWAYLMISVKPEMLIKN